MKGLVFVGMLPPGSHNPEERRFVEELAPYFAAVVYLRGIGVKGLRLHQFGSLPGRVWPALRRRAHQPPLRAGSLIILPFRTGPVRAANVAWLRHQLQHLLGSPTDWIFWTRFPSPELVEAIEPLPFARIVYEPIDRYASSPRFSKREQQRIVSAEARLIGRATVIAGAGGLATQFRTASGGSHWLSFGYDAARQSAGPGLPSHIGRPRLAIVGGLDWRIDEDLLVDLAARQPNSQLVLVGPCAGRWGRQLRRRNNVHWLGPVPPNRVGMLLRDCDVTLIPYRLTSWTRTCLPVKVFDYLTEGKPVVATPLPELASLGDAVVLALPEDFHAAVETASREDCPAARDRRRRLAARFTLQDRAQRAAALVNSPVARLVAR